MCSIYGAVFRPENDTALDGLDMVRKRANDRGRDGGRWEMYPLSDGRVAVLGNWRATPTPEIEKGRLQPYGGVVHNGTIANDHVLGRRDGEIDSEVLPRVLDRSNLDRFVESLGRVQGSYAIGCVTTSTVFLACNYRPLHYVLNESGSMYFASLEHHLIDVAPIGTRPRNLLPYTAMDITTFETVPLPRRSAYKAIVIASAGLDSTTVARKLLHDGYDVCLLHFTYGCQAQGREKDLIPKIAEAMGCDYVFIDLPYGEMKASSPLLQSDGDIAEGVTGSEFAHEWVPARNLAMFGLAVAYAEAHDYHYIALGNNLEEAGAYPDNEEQMFRLLDRVCDYAVAADYELRVLQPCGHLMKHEIVKLGHDLGTPYELTWSCYRNGEHHCGECGPCFMRKKAFERNGLVDPVFQRQETA